MHAVPSLILLQQRRPRPLPVRILLPVVICESDAVQRRDVQQCDWCDINLHMHPLWGRHLQLFRRRCDELNLLALRGRNIFARNWCKLVFGLPAVLKWKL